MDRDMKNKVLVVTGAAEGIGLAIATSFLDKGVKLAILLDVNENKGNESVTTLKHKYGNNRVVFYKCNVITDLEAIYQLIISDYKNVDILVNNAGVIDEKNIKRTINTNTVALMEWTMKFYEHMRTDKGGEGGTIMNTSSLFGHIISPYAPTYHASKFAIIGFSKSLGHHYNYDRTNVRVVTLCPGYTDTSLAKGLHTWDDSILSEYLEFLKKFICQPVKCMGEGAVDTYLKAESGSVWLIMDNKPAEKWDV